MPHAYAISMHKAQRDELTRVVMPLVISHAVLLIRTLQYTALT